MKPITALNVNEYKLCEFCTIPPTITRRLRRPFQMKIKLFCYSCLLSGKIKKIQKYKNQADIRNLDFSKNNIPVQRSFRRVLGLKVRYFHAESLFREQAIFELFFFVKKYLLVGASGMLWAGGSVSGSVRDVCMSHQSAWIYH